MSTQEIVVELGGARLRFATSFAELARYAGLHLEPLGSGSDGRADIVATLRWHEGPPPRDRLRARPWLPEMERLDRDLYRGEGRLAWFRIDELPGLELSFEWDGERLVVVGDYFYCLSRRPARDRLKRWVYHRRVDELRRRRFTTLLYYLVYYPCFWWLERRQDFHPIHAAGVEFDGRVVVLAGPSGVGKSTLSAGLAASPGARFLSDTFLLQRGTSVRPVREPLLLDEWSCRWLGEGQAFLRPIDWRYCLGRRGFHWAADRLSHGADVAALLFPRRAATPFLRRIPADRAHGQLGAAGLIVNDLRRYWAFAAVLETLDPTPIGAAREKAIAELTQGVPCLELGVNAAMTRGDLARRVAELGGLGGPVPAVATPAPAATAPR